MERTPLEPVAGLCKPPAKDQEQATRENKDDVEHGATPSPKR